MAENLRKTLADVLPLLEKIGDEAAGVKSSPEKWSKKEILGHLIDSACNNQHKFVRTMTEKRAEFTGYRQNEWVAAQKYDAAAWRELINLWHASNLHLARVIENAAPEVLTNEITIESAGTFTLEFIMTDYVEHLKHHLKQILPEAGLQNNFRNIYNT